MDRTSGAICIRCQEYLADWVEHGQTLLPAWAQEHCRLCATCGALYAELVWLKQQAGAVAVVDPGPDFARRVVQRAVARRRGLALAAVVLLAALLVWQSSSPWNRSTPAAQVVVEQPVAKRENRPVAEPGRPRHALPEALRAAPWQPVPDLSRLLPPLPPAEVPEPLGSPLMALAQSGRALSEGIVPVARHAVSALDAVVQDLFAPTKSPDRTSPDS
ncbi:MAG: hypothetical protein C4297_07230 [Gemmataceae bacterium]